MPPLFCLLGKAVDEALALCFWLSMDQEEEKKLFLIDWGEDVKEGGRYAIIQSTRSALPCAVDESLGAEWADLDHTAVKFVEIGTDEEEILYVELPDLEVKEDPCMKHAGDFNNPNRMIEVDQFTIFYPEDKGCAINLAIDDDVTCDDTTGRKVRRHSEWKKLNDEK